MDLIERVCNLADLSMSIVCMETGCRRVEEDRNVTLKLPFKTSFLRLPFLNSYWNWVRSLGSGLVRVFYSLWKEQVYYSAKHRFSTVVVEKWSFGEFANLDCAKMEKQICLRAWEMGIWRGEGSSGIQSLENQDFSAVAVAESLITLKYSET